jgi:hypothetical protein
MSSTSNPNPPTSWNLRNREWFAEIAPKREGAIAIFKEHPDIICVRVSNIVADDWGVRILITCVPTPGMKRLGKDDKDSCNIAAAWDVFSFNEVDWHARYCPWDLIFDSQLIEDVNLLADHAAKQGKLLTLEDAFLAVWKYRNPEEARRIGLELLPNPLTPPV